MYNKGLPKTHQDGLNAGAGSTETDRTSSQVGNSRQTGFLQPAANQMAWLKSADDNLGMLHPTTRLFH